MSDAPGFASTLRAETRSPLLQVLKTSLAAVTAWLLSNLLLGQPLPIFAAIAALLVVQPSVTQSITKGIERSVGVVLGVLLASAAGALFGGSTWVVLSVIVVSLIIAWALKLGSGSSNQIPISAMLVLALGSTPGYGLERVVETVIGALVALLVNLAIVPPVATEPAHRATTRLVLAIADSLDDLAAALGAPRTREDVEAMYARARRLRELQRDADTALRKGEESLMLNPRRGRHRRRLEEDLAMLTRANPLVTRVLGMARATRDHYDRALPEIPAVQAIVTELERAAHDLRLLTTPASSSSTTIELPALTAPIVVLHPDPAHWIVVGSLMEDLRRVREVIVGATDAA
ncbi:FUSC family protein [Ruicaihuangia caeni]|uniref:FUSC family protein n=1 Tax=Ruicaihuangia caeni TaxID=3042517 RepID=UPI00338E1B8B